MATCSHMEEGSTKPIKETNHDETARQPVNSCGKAIVCCIIIILFIAIIVLGGYVLYSKRRIPHLPEFKIESLRLNLLLVTPTALTVKSIWKWDVGFFVQDYTDNMEVTYHDVSVELFYKNESIVERDVPSFSQKNGGSDSKNLIFTMDWTSGNNSIFERIDKEMRTLKPVILDVNIHVTATYTNMWSHLNTNRHPIVGHCKDLSLTTSATTASATSATTASAANLQEEWLKGGTQTCEARPEKQ